MASRCPSQHPRRLSDWVLCADSPSIQLKIRFFPQVLDILLDQCRQWTIPNINPVINRPPEAIALCRKQSALLILQEELQHGRILDLSTQQAHELSVGGWRRGQIFEQLGEGPNILVGGIDDNRLALD